VVIGDEVVDDEGVDDHRVLRYEVRTPSPNFPARVRPFVAGGCCLAPCDPNRSESLSLLPTTTIRIKIKTLLLSFPFRWGWYVTYPTTRPGVEFVRLGTRRGCRPFGGDGMLPTLRLDLVSGSYNSVHDAGVVRSAGMVCYLPYHSTWCRVLVHDAGVVSAGILGGVGSGGIFCEHALAA